MSEKARILIIESCSKECPSYHEYVDRGYDDRDTDDWCEKMHKNIPISDKKFPKFCPLKEKS